MVLVATKQASTYFVIISQAVLFEVLRVRSDGGVFSGGMFLDGDGGYSWRVTRVFQGLQTGL